MAGKLSPRRALMIAVLIICCILFLYPRNPTATPSPLKDEARPPKSEPVTPAESKPQEAQEVQVQSSQRQQKLTIEKLRSLPLREQLAYQFPYNVAAKFPAFIWQTWKTTPASPQFEEKFRPTEASWTEKHPTFVHEVITDQVADHLIRHLYGAIPEVVEAFNALPLKILKADFFRYLILLARGGIYADIDTVALKAAQEWLPDNFKPNTVGLVIGIEADPDRPDWKKWYSRRIQFCQWTIQAKPGHPVLREIIANITEHTLEHKRAGKLKVAHDKVVEFTGPAVWTDVIMDFFNDPKYFETTSTAEEVSWKNFTRIKNPKRIGDVVVLPITSFSPGIGHSGAGDKNDPQAFVFHNFEGSWKPDSERHIEPKEDREKREREEREKKEKEAREKAAKQN
ncbi:nucleotide-diphospho-sugar transferase [Kalaharituber pfeilii]|nr:nucleotide-diphospho-sugar transferase [Kalaharituber pfeilii]